MKAVKYVFFKNKVWRRFSIIKRKQEKRMSAIEDARKEVNQHVPLAAQQRKLSGFLQAPNNSRIQVKFLMQLLVMHNELHKEHVEYLIKCIPLGWFE